MSKLEHAATGVKRLVGELTFDTVPNLFASNPLVGTERNENGNVTVDLSGVVKADSAGLALLVEWVSQARQDKIKLAFSNVPAQIIAMAELCDLDEVLPLGIDK